MKLDDRVAIVTGGSSGIGRGIALEFAAEGARVVIFDIQEKPKRGKYHERDVTSSTAQAIEQRGGRALFVQGDVADESCWGALLDHTAREFGQLDILVNNAGICIVADSQKLSIQQWDRLTAINLRAAFLATKMALPLLKKSRRGRIIHISSVQAFGGGGGPAYCASKAGLVNMTRDTALETAPYGITVNAICPGYVETAIQDYLSEEQVAQCRQRTPLQRFGTPRDIGRAAVFLASDDAAWITGIALPVDGGWMARIF